MSDLFGLPHSRETPDLATQHAESMAVALDQDKHHTERLAAFKHALWIELQQKFCDGVTSDDSA